MTFVHVLADDLVEDGCFKGIEVEVASLLWFRPLEPFSLCVEWGIGIVPKHRLNRPLFALIGEACRIHDVGGGPRSFFPASL